MRVLEKKGFDGAEREEKSRVRGFTAERQSWREHTRFQGAFRKRKQKNERKF